MRSMSRSNRAPARRRRRSSGETALGRMLRRNAATSATRSDTAVALSRPRAAHKEKRRSERVRRVEHPITRRSEEREVVAQHRRPEAREVVKEAAAPGGPGVEVHLQTLPQHGAGYRRARQVTGADVGDV